MHQVQRSRALACAAAFGLMASLASAQVVINEFQYDDTGSDADNREFIELYNTSGASLDISGWTVGGRDASGNNVIVTIPGALGSSTTVMPAGGFYVIGSVGLLNVNQTNATGLLENDAETIEVRNGPFATGTLIDAVVYESNKGAASHGVLPGDVAPQVGGGYWGNHQGVDIGAAPTASVRNSIARHYDGYDNNSNGRDFSNRRGTPGAPNSTGLILSYDAPNVDALAVGADVPGLTGSFVSPRVIDPTVVTADNPNAIPAAPLNAKAIVAWDPSGGGNGAQTDAHMENGGGFNIQAYFATDDMPVSTNASGVAFRGSEQTFYAFGGGDALTNLADLSGSVGLTGVGANAFSGIAWYYERVSESAAGVGDVSEKLYLVDAGDGGDSIVAGGMDWTILGTIDMSSVTSGWYNLSISVDALGNGVASFGNQSFNFTTVASLVGEFAIGYRENTQNGADGTPDYLRPPTFAQVPEPATLAALGLLGGAMLGRRRR